MVRGFMTIFSSSGGTAVWFLTLSLCMHGFCYIFLHSQISSYSHSAVGDFRTRHLGINSPISIYHVMAVISNGDFAIPFP